MSRGNFYSKKEDEALLMIATDHSDKTSTEQAELAQRYGLCTERNLNALAQHIKKLTTEPKHCTEQISLYGYEEAEALEKADKYDQLLRVVIDEAKLYNRTGADNLLEIPIVRFNMWLQRNETKRYFSRVEELEMEGK